MDINHIKSQFSFVLSATNEYRLTCEQAVLFPSEHTIWSMTS